jgi:hypothetical protein
MRCVAILLFLAVTLSPGGAAAFDRYAGLAESEHQASELSKALNLIMSTATPDLYFHKREIMVEEYEKAPINKALAVNAPPELFRWLRSQSIADREGRRSKAARHPELSVDPTT